VKGISSKTKQNADHATQADRFMKESNEVVLKADQSMEEIESRQPVQRGRCWICGGSRGSKESRHAGGRCGEKYFPFD
jgi:hypothetical protein